MDPNDLIANLLKSTGLSCDDLLSKLQQYKSTQPENDEQASESCQNEENSQDDQQYDSNNSVILETKCSSVDLDDVGKSETDTQSKTINNGDSDSILSAEKNEEKSAKEDPVLSEIDNVIGGLEKQNGTSETQATEVTTVIDHSYSSPTVSVEAQDISVSSLDEFHKPQSSDVDHEGVEDLPKSEDSLRNILRMQLSSLRNMKKSSGYLPDLQKKSMFFHNLKKKRKSCDVNPLATLTDKEEGDKPGTSNENSVLSLSDGTDFVNVAGGVDVGEEKEERRFAAITDACNEEKSSVVDEKASPSKEIKNILTNYRRKMSLNYFDAKRYKLTVPKEDSSALPVKKTVTENFNQDSDIKNSEKSPFVSNSLDVFLNESSQLKVSYDIPKLGAEEGISENTKSPYDDVNRTPKTDTIIEDTGQKEKPKLVKAKTLADMRRQFEKLKAQEKPATSTPIKKFKAVKDLAVREKKVRSNRNSFILYNNKKLFTTGKIKDQCVASITCNISKKNPPKKRAPKSRYRKPSLLSCLTQNKSCSVKYKPGPLCKKAELQNVESKDKWTTELKTLPKIFLEVAPEINKPIDRKVAHLLPVFDDTLITEERADFALSVLKPQKETKTFKFHIPYTNNQEKMVVRKPSKPVVRPNVCNNEQTDVASDVSKILDDIITYVEIKEIEPTLLKYDDTAEVPCEEVIGNSVKTKVRKIKRNKLDLELLRLNCKVIDVATNEEEDKDCTKPYCRLGCICKSLLCENVFSNHCQLVGCMFGCMCPPVTSKKVITNNNSLSVHTVNHLEDKVKKNLAKEEREFTQTLIHTDNDTIFLGTGKLRRSTKPPKKYTDYVGEDVVIDDSCSIPRKDTLKLKNCTVSLEKLNLFDIEPYCFYHHRHNCHCGGETVDVVPAPAKKPKVPDQIPKIRIVKTKEDQHKAWYDSCARIRKVFAEYKVRNKDPLYNERLRIKNLGKRKYENPEKVVDNIPIEPGRVEPVVPKKPSKRKQTFNVREDVVLKPSRKEFALQRRKPKFKAKVYRQELNIFDGEIKVPLEDNQEMLSIIGEENASLDFLRILPWCKLIENFQKGKISIWSKEKRPSMLLCNSAGHFPPNDFVDIRNTTQMSDIMKWILTDTLPPEISRDLMHVILTPQKNHYLISGHCLKTIEEGKKDTPEQLNNGAEVLPLGTSQISVCSESNESGIIEETEESSPIEVVNIDDNDTTTLKPGLQENAKSKPKQESVLLTKLLNVARKKLLIPTSVEVAPDPTTIKKPKLNQKQEVIKLVTKKPYPKVLSLPTTRQLQQVSASQLKLMSGMKAIPVKVVRNPKEIMKLASLCREVHAESSPPIVCEPESGNPKKIIKLASLCREVQAESAPPVICESESATPEPVPTQPTDIAPVASDKNCVASKIIHTRPFKCAHKDMHNRNKALLLTSKEFTKHKLYLSTETDGGDITVPLPKLANNYKWRMIYLNSDFTFLNFVRPNYSIKYTDLMDVVKMAANTKMTTTLRNKEFCDCYKHPLFGIFCVPDYQDRLFIGPYLPNEVHSIETLRYLQGRLIDTQIFNKMLGRKVEKIPTWIHELTRPFSLPSGLLIDITEDEYREIIDLDSDSDERPVTDSLLCQPFVEELTAEELKLKHNINRYIITNIPHLGYFGACQRDSKAIEVFWPGGTAGYRFPNVTFAKNLLIQYLSQIFCTIPHDFKINVIIMTHLDLLTNRPVATKYFTQGGPYFCGEFGIFEKTVPDEILEKYQVPSTDLLLKTHQDAEKHEYAMTRLFGLFLMTNEELRNHPEPENILQWAKSEIYVLKKLADNYESEKTDLQNIIRVRSQKIKEMRRESRTKDAALRVSETIEITDSDEEEKKSSSANNTKKNSTTENDTQNGDRSLLKPKIWMKRRSLLKNNQQVAKKSEPTGLNSVNAVHSNIVLNKNKMLITKTQ